MTTENSDASQMMKAIRYVTVILFCVSAYYLYGYFVEAKEKQLRKSASSSTTSNEIYSAIGGAFELTDQDGNRFSSTQLQGKLSLIYFGFTFCPDICPESLGKLAEIKATLDKYNLPIQIVFISIDPNRDTSQSLKAYLTGSFENIIGLTGTEEEIREVARNYKVYYAVSPQTKDDPDDYLLDHSSFSYLLDYDGNVVKHFGFSQTAQEVVDYLVQHYKKSQLR